MRGIENNDRVGDFTVERDCDMKGLGIQKVAGNNFGVLPVTFKALKSLKLSLFAVKPISPLC